MSADPRPPTSLAGVVDELRRRTGASRATVRRCLPGGDAELVAEALGEGVASMAGRSVPGVVEAPTYRYLAERLDLLVQDDVVASPVAPPASLVEEFHVLAQMLAPVVEGGEMIATISVHEQGRTRAWSEADVEALRAAQAAVAALLSGGAP